jgi:hypothetical protein
MALPPVTSAVFFYSYPFSKMWVARRNIVDISATPPDMKRERYVCIMKNITHALNENYEKCVIHTRTLKNVVKAATF